MSRKLPVLARCAAPLTVATLAIAAAPAAAQAPLPSEGPYVIATGIGRAEVQVARTDRQNEAAIRQAVKAAADQTTPRAVAAARERAAQLAAAGGLTLGRLVSIADQATPYGPYFGPFGQFGTFGPDRFCGKVARLVRRRDAQGHVRRV
jgi:Protein of unknown function (DUF541)